LSLRVSHHHDTVADVLSYVRMVLEGSVAMRAAARVTRIISDVVKLPLGTPQWSTIRLWLMHWGQGTLRVLDERPEAVLAHCSAERLELKFGWLADYRKALREWSEFVAVIETVLDFVREQGLYSGAGDDLKETLESLQLGSAGRRLAEELQAFVRDESLKAHAGERLPGSTEVLESCFGKLKSLEREHSRSGFTGFVLSLCAVLAPTTAEVVGQALQSSRTKEVLNWCHENLGLSVQSKRKLAYNPH